MTNTNSVSEPGGAVNPEDTRKALGKKPNVVLIYADDLGIGDLSCYGTRSVQTPNADRLAAEGTRFDSAYATAATCTPSRFALLTGAYAWRKPGRNILDGDAALIVPTNELTLPKVFKQAGYATGIVGKWHLGLGDGTQDWNGELKPGPLEVGFDESFIIPATADRVPCVFVRGHHVENLDPADPIVIGDAAKNIEPTGRTHPHLLRVTADGQHSDTIIDGISRIGYMTGGKSARWVDEEMCDVFAEEAVAFIRRQAKENKPFFLVLNTHDVHAPRTPHPRFVGATDMGPRGDSIVQFDFQVGEVLKVLDELGIADNTMVILSSDNGPILYDGYDDRSDELVGDHEPWGRWRGTKYSILEAGTRVPFLVRWPGRVPAGRVSTALISQIDLAASIAAILGVPVTDTELPDSLALPEALLGQTEKARDYFVEESWSALAIRAGRWKYVTPTNAENVFVSKRNIPMGYSPGPQLYDLQADPREYDNVAEAHPDLVAAFQSLESHIRQTPATRLAPGDARLMQA
jgi:arylsulfatase A-like enzyme